MYAQAFRTFVRRIPVLSLIERYPKTSLGLGLMLCSPIADRYLQRRAKRVLSQPILDKLERGSGSDIALPDLPIRLEREKEFSNLKLVIDNSKKGYDVSKIGGKTFKVVLGPSGTGKTYLTRKLCKEYPFGVLYHEVFDPCVAAQELAHSSGMLLEPIGVFDLALSFVPRGRYRHYHVLPKNPTSALAYVLAKVGEQAARFKNKHGYPPTFVIDGADLIAKHDPKAFIALVDRAKFLANVGILQIVFVSSEGIVIPLLLRTSSSTREAPVVEVLDISEEDAVDFLKKEMPADLAKFVFSVTGGRLVHMIQAFEFYQMKCRPYSLESSRTKNLIESFLVIKYGENARLQALKQGDSRLQDEVIRLVFLRRNVTPNDIVKVLHTEKKAEVLKAVDDLLASKLFRYNAAGLVTFHSKIVEDFLKKDLSM